MASSQIHIVHIVESFGGGCLTVLSALTHELHNDFRHTVIYSIRAETPTNIKELFGDKVDLIHLEMRFFKNISLLFSSISYIKNFLIHQSSPIIVHCHSSIAGVIGRLAAWQAGIPVIYTPHAYSFLASNPSWITRRTFYAAEWLLARLGTATIACGDEEYRIARNLSGQRPVFLVHNGIDAATLPALDQATPERAHKRLVVGAMGRTSHQQDVTLFNSIAAALHESCTFVWIGADVDNTDILDFVQKTGWLPHEPALRELARTDVVLHLTRYDGLSCALLEAMALQKVVIATDTPSNRSIVKHGETGFLISDSANAVDKLRLLLKDDALRHSMGNAARQYVEKHFRSVDMATQYASIYRKLCIEH